MARLPRLEVLGWPHLLVQRVHAGHWLAKDAQDRALLLSAMREAARTHGVSIHAYCLADDHFHLLLTPDRPDAMSLFMQAVGRRYVSAYNRRHGRQGGLWSGRYRATVLEPTLYLLDAMVWVEGHGQRVGVASPWAEADAASSARHHLGQGADPLVTDHAIFWALGNTPFEREAAWRRLLEEGLGASRVRALSEAMHKGWALVPEPLATKLEVDMGRRVAPRPRGRPKKVRLVDDLI